MPADFADEVFSSLQERTFRIEFEVPKTDFEVLGWLPTYLPAVLPPDLAPKVPHTFDEPVGGIAVGKQLRKTATYLVAQGYDVLFFDKRGHGYSEGIVDGMGEDIFRALDLLEAGVIVEDGITLSLSIITPDGRRLHGEAAAHERLLGADYKAKTKPVVLRGFSYGSSQLQKAMAMNYSNLPVEYRFNSTKPFRIFWRSMRSLPPLATTARC
jgi:hypothetical protein